MILPIVSIIIPAYNCAPYIERTLSSVKAQTYPKDLLQVIIVNDGSTDNTSRILKRYENLYTIIHTENKGVSHARNTGLKYAEGDYIQYLDSDDLLVPKKIEHQVRALIKSGGDVAYGNWQKFKEVDGEIMITEKIERKITGDPEIALFTDFWCPPAALLYSRKIVEKIGPWKEWLPVIQDARYFLDAAMEGGKFVYTSFIAASYRGHTIGSLSTQSKAAFVIDCYENAADLYKKWIAASNLSPERRDALASVLTSTLSGLIRCDKKRFNTACEIIKTIKPHCTMNSSFIKYNLSKYLGIKQAEILSYHLRKIFL